MLDEWVDVGGGKRAGKSNAVKEALPVGGSNCIRVAAELQADTDGGGCQYVKGKP